MSIFNENSVNCKFPFVSHLNTEPLIAKVEISLRPRASPEETESHRRTVEDTAAFICAATTEREADKARIAKLETALLRTNTLARELITRAGEIDRMLVAKDGRTPDCELGEVVRLRAQIDGDNAEALKP